MLPASEIEAALGPAGDAAGLSGGSVGADPDALGGGAMLGGHAIIEPDHCDWPAEVGTLSPPMSDGRGLPLAGQSDGVQGQLHAPLDTWFSPTISRNDVFEIAAGDASSHRHALRHDGYSDDDDDDDAASERDEEDEDEEDDDDDDNDER